MAAIKTAAGNHFFPETYAWTMYHAKPPKNVSEIDYSSNESWNIARNQEKKSSQILWPNFEIFWLKNAQIHNLTWSNTLTSDCQGSSHFTTKQENFEWLGSSRRGGS